MSPTVEAVGSWRDLSVTVRDGLRLHVREYGLRTFSRLPVICLPGLSRNAADFHELALHLSSHDRHPRRVLAVDYRGRGRSDHDPDWRNYTPHIEAEDVLAVMAAAGIPHAAFVGTSRGGLVIMQLAALRPTVLRAAVLNDIGPRIEPAGLFRIKRTLEAMPKPESWADAEKLLRRFYGAVYPRLDQAGWASLARKLFLDQNGRPVAAYDPQLRRHLAPIEIDQALPTLWPQFDALGRVPTMVVRGMDSDLLSAEALCEMRARRPDLAVLEIAGEGHPPLLVGARELGRIAGFLHAAVG